jgi:hypothetical protein
MQAPDYVLRVNAVCVAVRDLNDGDLFKTMQYFQENASPDNAEIAQKLLYIRAVLLRNSEAKKNNKNVENNA